MKTGRFVRNAVGRGMTVKPAEITIFDKAYEKDTTFPYCNFYVFKRPGTRQRDDHDKSKTL